MLASWFFLNRIFIMSFRIYSFVLISMLLLTSCSPHPGTGVWVSEGENNLGLSRIIVAFEGKAEFKTTKPVEANWHCFWGKEDENTLTLDCTPSINPDQARQFKIISKQKMAAEFRENDNLIAKLKRIDENPVLSSK